jgi:hypothetical protein
MVQSRRPRAGVRLPTAEVSASPTDQLHDSLAAVGPRRPNGAGYVDQVLTGVWFRDEGCDNGSGRLLSILITIDGLELSCLGLWRTGTFQEQ